jgi:hypothetical protein
MAVAFPDDTQRLGIFGATGSGKTQAALWHLSHRHYELMPWVVYNTKSDASIDAIPYAREIEIGEVPAEPGVFIVRPLPHQQDELEAHLWAIWQRGGTGVYIDEGYAMGNNNQAFRALLTQGRSKGIPMIVLSQRPVWLDRFVFSESEFLQAFRLQHRKDRAVMEELIPAKLERLPAYHSWYYDALGNKLSEMGPVPSLPVIHATFERRLSRERRRGVV